jgi:hypothetical protein
MAAKIRVDLDNNTGAGFDDIRSDANKAAGAIDNMGDQAGQTANQVEKIGKAGESLKSLERLGKMVVSAQVLGAAIRGITASVRELSDDGSPAFVELAEASETAYHAMLDLGNDPVVQEWASNLAATIKNDLAPALASIPSYVQETHNWLAKVLVQTGEYVGLLEGVADTLEEDQQRQVKRNEEKKKEVAIARERVNVEEKIAALEKKLADEREAANIANITDQQTLLSMLSDEIDALRTLEKEGSRDAKAKEERLKKIETLRRQQAKAADDAIANEIKKQEEASQKRYDIDKKFQDAIAENKKIALNAEQDKIKSQQDEANKILDALGKAIAEAKGLGGGNAIDEAKQGLDKRKVLKQVAKSRGDKAEQEQAEIEAEQAKNSSPGDDPKLIAQREAQANARIRAARKKAESSAFADAKRGKLGGNEVNDAQSDLINSGIQQANATGKLGDTTAQLAQEAVRNAQATQNAQAEQQQQIDALRKELAASTAAINGNASKFRGQQGGRQG